MQGEPPYLGAQKNIPALNGKIQFLEDAKVAGHLYDLGNYPGLIETRINAKKPLVRVELYEILDADALGLLDEYESFFPESPGSSYYLRKPVPLEGSEKQAWCYFYNESIEDCPLIESGCWRTYVEENT